MVKESGAWFNGEYDLGDNLEAYFFGGFSKKHANGAGFFRRSGDDRTIRAIYPTARNPFAWPEMLADEGGRRFGSNTEASGRFHTDWLNMMYPRLKLARNLLRDDGAGVDASIHKMGGAPGDCYAVLERLTLRVSVAPGTPYVYGDGERILQVLANLVGNAVKFTEPGGEVAVQVEPYEGAVQFSVRDTGISLPASRIRGSSKSPRDRPR